MPCTSSSSQSPTHGWRRPSMMKTGLNSKKMGGLLGVSSGSREAPRFVEMRLSGTNPEGGVVVVVGKGITFDSGGISIKPSQNMGDMKGDMTGAAVVSSVVLGVCEARLSLPFDLVALIPICENMPSGSAIRPGDVLRISDGTTIEVDNTDAEGRLILSDALVYGQTFSPKTIIDVATLTGAVDVALGDKASGVFCNDDALFSELQAAGFQAGESLWRLPVFDEYKKYLASDIADMKNSGGSRSGGASSGAVFLKHFVNKNTPWAHIDIGGTMMFKETKGFQRRGMSAVPTRALLHWLATKASQ
eukprot:TRINITY_DN6445_c0_g1_i2.p1 TRINITY_DN6445_c0_g1~~TRINITY_DN6445_c0_g1_i2.p1  ORF type:complete len:304 (-),score=60.64 TRINITY_DN6445_c0_g1_i2:47-958(-)